MQDNFIRTHDNLKLYTCAQYAKAPVAQLLFLHGYTEHCHRYDELADQLVQNGISVLRYDQRGFGKSEGRRAFVDRFTQYTDDLALAIKKLGQREVPLYLAGVSMGGLIVAKHLIDRGDMGLSGAIFIAAALKVDEDLSPMLQKMSGLLSAITPKLKTVKLDTKFLSRDPKVIADYLADPLVYHEGAYARTGSEILRATEYIQDKMQKISCPLLILHGTEDKLADPAGSKRLHEMATSSDKSLELYEGLYHEICNEPEKQMVNDRIQNWILERAKSLVPTTAKQSHSELS